MEHCKIDMDYLDLSLIEVIYVFIELTLKGFKYFKLCLIILKDTFIKALFLNIQENASVDVYAARDTCNSSSNLCYTLLDLRYEEIFSNMPVIEEITGIDRDLDLKKWKIIKEKWRAYYLEDINFLMSLIILFSTLDPERDYYFYIEKCFLCKLL